MQYVLSIDPGKSSGIALGKYSDTEPYQLVKAWQFQGGVVGLIDFFMYKCPELSEVGPWCEYIEGTVIQSFDLIVTEKFVPIAGKGFSQTLDSVEPLRGEGALIALGVMPDYPDPTWRRANEQYLFNAPSKAKKRSLLKEFLKDTGNYVYGKQLGQPDNEDAVSAIAHAISYLTRVENHKPTYDLVSDWNSGRIENRKG